MEFLRNYTQQSCDMLNEFIMINVTKMNIKSDKWDLPFIKKCCQHPFTDVWHKIAFKGAARGRNYLIKKEKESKQVGLVFLCIVSTSKPVSPGDLCSLESVKAAT